MEKSGPTSFLMVCLGNICRSPLAEGILQEKARAAGLDWKVDSAGTTSYHIKSNASGGDYGAPGVPTNDASRHTIQVDSGGGNISITEAH